MKDWGEPGADPEPGLGSALLVLSVALKVMGGAAVDGRAALHKGALAAGSPSGTRTHVVGRSAALLLPVS